MARPHLYWLLPLALAVALSGCTAEPEPDPPTTHYPTRDEVLTRAMARVDGDGDGSLQLSEYGRYTGKVDDFHRHDLDGDDTLSIQELEQATLDADPTRDMRLGKRPPGGNQSVGPKPRGGPPRAGKQPGPPGQQPAAPGTQPRSHP